MSELITAIDDEQVGESRSGAGAPPLRPTDGERLMRFWRHRDEAALAELIEVHAGMVWGVCSQMLRRREDVEDAFQATFLILARKARSIRAMDSAAGWLYRVAFRTALLARNRRRRTAETPLIGEPASDDDEQLAAIARSEECRVLLEELHALPLQYRQPLVLCYLEGRSRSEAADELGVTPQSVKGRLARGTRLLRSRMVGRGVALSTTMAVVSASLASAEAAAPPAVISNTAALAASFAWKLAGAKTTAHGAAAALAQKGLLSMTLVTAAKPAVAVLGLCLTAGLFAVATADDPQAGAGGAAIVLLAGDDAQGAGAAGEDELSADIAIDAEAPLQSPPGDDANDGDANEQTLLPGAPASALASQPTGGGAGETRSSASTADDLYAAPPSLLPSPGESKPATRAAASAMAGTPPADVLMKWIGGGPPMPADPPTQPGPSNRMRVSQPAQSHQVFASATASSGDSSTSEDSLKLESEYWAIKERALRKKAEALTKHVKGLKEAGQASTTETLAAEAEAELTLAEVKLCELNALRVKEALEALEASQLKVGDAGPKVEMIQRQLNARLEPSPKLDVDGEFGPLTQEAVIKFQQRHGLKPTGVVDAATMMLLVTPTPAQNHSNSRYSDPRAPTRIYPGQAEPPRQASGWSQSAEERPTAAAVPWIPPAVAPTYDYATPAIPAQAPVAAAVAPQQPSDQYKSWENSSKELQKLYKELKSSNPALSEEKLMEAFLSTVLTDLAEQNKQLQKRLDELEGVHAK